jgi:hypothetical protein
MQQQLVVHHRFLAYPGPHLSGWVPHPLIRFLFLADRPGHGRIIVQ